MSLEAEHFSLALDAPRLESQMDQLFKKVLLRTLGFLLVLSLSPWLFVLVEYTEQNDVEEKHKLLKSVYESMASKYNMSIADFNNFSSMAYEALSEPKLQWTYATSLRFVFQAVTTIGKKIILKELFLFWRHVILTTP